MSTSISALAGYGATDRWVMTLALLVVACCNAITGLGLRPAARYGRILLVSGGIFGLIVAVSPEPSGGGSLRHVVAAGLGCAAMSAWPLAARRREPRAPAGLRPAASAWATGVILAMVAWFCAQVVSGGAMIGLAERVLTGAQTVWPLVVVLTAVAARQSRQAAARPPVLLPHAPGPPALRSPAPRPPVPRPHVPRPQTPAADHPAASAAEPSVGPARSRPGP